MEVGLATSYYICSKIQLPSKQEKGATNHKVDVTEGASVLGFPAGLVYGTSQEVLGGSGTRRDRTGLK